MTLLCRVAQYNSGIESVLQYSCIQIHKLPYTLLFQMEKSLSGNGENKGKVAKGTVQYIDKHCVYNLIVCSI